MDRAGIQWQNSAAMRHGSCKDKRMRLSLGSFAWLGLSLSWTACSYHLLSPPSRAVPLESPAVLPEGTHAVAIESSLSSSVFEPDVLAGAVRYRRGLSSQLDGSVDLTLMHLLRRPSDVSAWPQAYALRAGLKYQVAPILSLMAGLGAGGSAAGGFVSPDLGLSLGYENPYLVPFVQLRGFASLPVAARRVYLGTEDDADRFSTPQPTWGASGTLGLRVPLAPGPAAHSIAIGVAVTPLCDAELCKGYLSIAANFEALLPRL